MSLLDTLLDPRDLLDLGGEVAADEAMLGTVPDIGLDDPEVAMLLSEPATAENLDELLEGPTAEEAGADRSAPRAAEPKKRRRRRSAPPAPDAPKRTRSEIAKAAAEARWFHHNKARPKAKATAE